MKKVLCTILALTMLFAVCVMPTYADAGVGNVKVRLEVTPMEGPLLGAESKTAYKVQVYLDSEKTLSALDVGLTFDGSVFDLLYRFNNRYTVVGQYTVSSTSFGTLSEDSDNSIFKVLDGHGYKNRYVTNGHGTEARLPGAYTDNKLRLDMKANVKASENTVLNAEMESEGKLGVYFHWSCFENGDGTGATDVLLGGHEDPSMGTYTFAGEQAIFSFVIALKDGLKENLPNGTHETTIGIDERQITEIKGRYSTNNAPNAKDSAGFADFDSKTDATVTCEEAKLQVKVEKPSALEMEKPQLKLTWDDPDGDGVPTVGAPALLRVTSKISDEDWNKYLFNTGTPTETNSITELGFVAYKSTKEDCAGYTLENFKTVMGGKSVTSYSRATTDYIKHIPGQDAEFGAILKFSSSGGTSKPENRDRLIRNAAYMSYYKFKDADGDVLTIMCNDVKLALIQTNWETLKEQYAAAYPNKA